MGLLASQSANCCHPNALMTLKEYLEDYASSQTKERGDKVIKQQIVLIPNKKVRSLAAHHLAEISEGSRDFRF